jgi:hypothetical protein
MYSRNINHPHVDIGGFELLSFNIQNQFVPTFVIYNHISLFLVGTPLWLLSCMFANSRIILRNTYSLLHFFRVDRSNGLRFHDLNTSLKGKPI